MEADVPTMRNLTARIHDMQQRIVLARQELSELEVTGSAGGGLVTVRMAGSGEVTRVVIDQAAIDQGDATSVSDLVFTALYHATEALKAATAEKMSAVSAGFPGVPDAH